ncbi:MAG: S41 family peptidase [Crocinitomicaceae bacterium]|jgi:carboxyl-terminal processing protease|nr:S41 family peptidase [Crocinitomicaceae bacterium]
MHYKNFLLKPLFFSALLLISLGTKAQSNGFEVIKSLELMDQIYENLELYFVDELQPGKLSKVAIDAMLKELDPYTVYYHESNIEDYRLMTTGQYGGIGALIKKVDDYIVISEPYESNPAQKSGLMAGDKILEIDGKTMFKKTTDQVSDALKGPKGTVVKVLIERLNEGKKTIEITRDEIKIPDVPYYGIIKDKVGYISLNSFTQTAAEEVKKGIKEMQKNGMNQLILDLRGNGGGLLIEAVKIVNFFVPKDQVVVFTKGRVKEENYVYKTMEEPIALGLPLIILIDEGSASASEIVAGSLQDLDKAVIIGEQSYGKGLVQRTYDLKYGSKVKITIAKYYTPSGRCVQRLEYYDKETGAKPKDIPDSLLRKFKTKNGREVIDGRGIDPDIAIEKEELSRLSALLFTKNLLFNYATEYHAGKKEIVGADDFRLTEEEYTSFKNYVLKEKLNYTSLAEEALKKMKEAAEKEGVFEEIKMEYEKTLEKVSPNQALDLENKKKEILELLENEIVSRYYFQKGRTINSFQHDPVVIKAIETAINKVSYDAILKN